MSVVIKPLISEVDGIRVARKVNIALTCVLPNLSAKLSVTELEILRGAITQAILGELEEERRGRS